MRKHLAILIAAGGLLSLAFAPAPPPKVDPPRKPDPSKVDLPRILEAYPKDEQAIEQVFLRALGRKPTDRQLKAALAHIRRPGTQRANAYDDLLWALSNTLEGQAKQKEKRGPGKPNK